MYNGHNLTETTTWRIKMSFIYNAVQNGWNVRKKNDSYIFTKKHQGKKEVFLDTYLNDFVEENVDLNKLLLSSSS